MYIAPSIITSIGAGGSADGTQNQHSGYEGNPSYFNIVAEGGLSVYVQNHAKAEH